MNYSVFSTFSRTAIHKKTTRNLFLVSMQFIQYRRYVFGCPGSMNHLPNDDYLKLLKIMPIWFSQYGNFNANSQVPVAPIEKNRCFNFAMLDHQLDELCSNFSGCDKYILLVAGVSIHPLHPLLLGQPFLELQVLQQATQFL